MRLRPVAGQAALFDVDEWEAAIGALPIVVEARPEEVGSTPTHREGTHLPGGGDVGTRTGLASPSAQAPAGVMGKARANLAALEVLATLRAGKRAATDAERAILARWSGWGAVPKVFDEADSEFAAVRAALRMHLDEKAWAAARRTVLNAHYTDPAVVRCMWDALGELGFKSGRVLEPGCGSGAFIGAAPAGARMTGVELDPTTAAICAALYPAADIRAEGFEASRFADASFDAAVGNVPFGKYVLADRAHNKGRHSIHNHFVLKALHLVKPGGVVAVLTSRYTLDAADGAARREIAGLADLIGAVRLPEGAMKATAGTDAVMDVLVLRRREAGAEPKGATWAETAEVAAAGGAVTLNEYFAALPANVLGELRCGRGMYRDDEMIVKATGPLVPALTDALARIVDSARDLGLTHAPKAASKTGKVKAVSEPVPIPAGERKEGAIVVAPESTTGFARKVGGEMVAYVPRVKKDVAELTAVIGLRDTLISLLEHESEGCPDATCEATRAMLGRRYAAYVEAYGALNRFKAHTRVDKATGEETTWRARPAMGGFRQDDPDYRSVLALEMFDAETQAASPAPIFTRRAIVARPWAKRAESASDALAISLDQTGRVDIDLIADLLEVTEAGQARSRLGSMVWDDPATGECVVARSYLSGNVREKLGAALVAAADDPRWAPNVEALRAILPPDVPTSDIDAGPGATWIPPSDVETFMKDVLGVEHGAVEYAKVISTWAIRVDRWSRQSVACQSTYGTRRLDAVSILASSCNQSAVKVYDEVEINGETKSVLNQDETLLAREKQEALCARFGEWVWEDAERADRLTAEYNRRFNSIVLPEYDGSHLTFPGLAEYFQPHAHQRNAVWRMICDPTVGVFHEVGAGKAQPLDAPVLTPSGYRPMGDLKVGDEVIAGDGTSTTVTGVFPQGEMDNYRVTFTDGATVECNDEHLWQVQTNAGKALGRAPRILPLRELVGRNSTAGRTTTLRDSKGAAKWEVPTAPAADFDCGLPRLIDPYLLGLILGDGSIAGGQAVQYTSADAELVTAFRAALPAGHTLRFVGNDNYPYAYVLRRPHGQNYSEVTSALRDLGLMGTNSHSKFVPRAYKEAPIAVRLAVLQGLMDTDGTISVASTYGNRSGLGAVPPTFTTVSPHLAEDVAWLVRSLGGTARIHPGTKRCNGQSFAMFRVTAKLPPGVAPFRLARKAERVRDRTKYKIRRAIVSVERIGRKPMQCITVAHPSHLYVTSDFVVTHNSAVAVIALQEMKRLGLVRKPMITCPNNVLDQFAAEYLRLYPLAKVLVFDDNDATPGGRKEFMARAAAGEWDCILVNHSTFNLMPMSVKTRVEFLNDTIARFEAAIAESRDGKRLSVKRLELAKKRLEEKVKALLNPDRKDDGINFELMGVDYLVIDECDLYKNLHMPSSEGRGGKPSQRAENLDMVLTWLRGRKPKHYAAGMTGTPVANTLGEMYVMQHYFQPEVLEAAGLDSYDEWAATFVRSETKLELAPDGKNYRMQTRPSTFVNLPELLTMFRSFADVKLAEDLKLPVPAIVGGRPAAVVVEGSDALRAYIETIVERAERIRGGCPETFPRVDKRTGESYEVEDNMLLVCTDGRKVSLDTRAVGLGAPADGGKIRTAAANIARIYAENAANTYTGPDGEESERRGALQMVFCDLGTPGGSGWNAYEALRRDLAAAGVPAESVRFIHEAKNDAARRDLFEACRNGTVSVLVGSTEKMGAGTNVQARLVALHHIDGPWRPRDVTQRDGRGIRQGNQHEEVYVFRYVTEGSFDVYIWQTLERKARFIYQVMSGKITERSADDIGEVALSFAEIKALATGNPLILEEATVRTQVARLARLQRGHERDQGALRYRLTRAAERIEGYRASIATLTSAVSTWVDTTGEKFTMTLGEQTFTDRKVAGSALINRMRADLGLGYYQTVKRRPVGTLGGFALELGTAESPNGKVVTWGIPGAVTSGFFDLSRILYGADGSRLVVTIESALRDIEARRGQAIAMLDEAEREREAARARIGQPFKDAELLASLRVRAADLTKQLTALEKKPGERKGAA